MLSPTLKPSSYQYRRILPAVVDAVSGVPVVTVDYVVSKDRTDTAHTAGRDWL